MFKHTINNPNKLKITKDNFIVVPFGYTCTSALICRYANLRKFALPFDWCSSAYPNKLQKVLENDFRDFIPDVHNKIFDNKYGFQLAHFDKDINRGIETYKRRIKRFKNIMNEDKQSKKLYFIYVNSNFMKYAKARTKKFNDDKFNEMLEFEIFKKKNYPNIDYNILCFNFVKENIPQNSNIINIVLQTDKYGLEIPAMKLHHYCAKIMVDLFKSSYFKNTNNKWIGPQRFNDA